MMVFKDSKLVAVINDKTMSSISKDDEFNTVYEGMIKNGIQQLAKVDSSSDSCTSKIVVKKVSPDTLGVVAGELQSLGYTVKVS